MTLRGLFKKRQSIYRKKILSYLKYVLNDHFVIAMLILLGAGAFAYSDYIRTLQPGEFFPALVGMALLSLILVVGRIGLFLERADIIFILPKENVFKPLMNKLALRSFFIQVVPLLLVSLLIMPLLVGGGFLQFTDWVFVFISLLSLKGIFLIVDLYHNHEGSKIRQPLSTILFFLFSFVGLCMVVFISPLLGMLVLLAASGIALVLYKKISSRSLKWEWMIQNEQNRKQIIYRFFNLFTDVPFIGSQTRRLRLLDPVIKWTTLKKTTPQEYFLRRVFFRNTTYSGLVLRLLVIASLILAFTNNLILSYSVSLLFNYLIAFQLLPLSQHIDKAVQFSFYPVFNAGKIKAMRTIITQVSMFIGLVFAIIELSSGIYTSAGVLGLNFIFTLLFTYYYVPKRLLK